MGSIFTAELTLTELHPKHM